MLQIAFVVLNIKHKKRVGIAPINFGDGDVLEGRGLHAVGRAAMMREGRTGKCENSECQDYRREFSFHMPLQKEKPPGAISQGRQGEQWPWPRAPKAWKAENRVSPDFVATNRFR